MADPHSWEEYLATLPSDPWDVYTDYPREAGDVHATQPHSLGTVPLPLAADAQTLSVLTAFSTALGALDHGREFIWVLDGAVPGGDPLPLRADLRTGTLANLQERFLQDRLSIANMRRAAGVAAGIMALRRAAPPGRFAKQQAHPICQAAFGVEPPGEPRPDFILRIAEPNSVAKLDYRSDLYDEATAESLARHIGALLRRQSSWDTLLLTDAHQAMLDEQECKLMLEAWKSESTDLGGVAFVHEMVQQRARGESSEKIAIIPAEGPPWSYRQLDAAASELALTLAGLGSSLNEAGGRVPMLVRRSVAMIIAIYGILRAGQAYVPLDPSWPDKRQCVVIDDVEASALVIGEACTSPKDCITLPIIRLSEDGRPQAMTNFVPACVQLPLPRPKPEDSVYILYTSGTTGKPKGVDVPHLGLAGRTLWLQHTWPLNDTSTVTQKIPVTFAMSEWELFWPLCFGARLALAAEGLHGDPQHVAELHVKHAVTHTVFVPSLLEQLMEELDAKTLPNVGCLICCGEALRASTARAALKSLPNAEVVNLYGPTEASMTMLRFPANPTQKDLLRFPIGVPIENTEVYISWAGPPSLDLSPLLIKGELGFGGPFVANGYWRLPELTEQKFVSNPHAPGRVYRTGDLARWRSDGCLEFLGRVDQQVKFNGVRIELGEIESTLGDVPGVASAAAFLAPPHLVAACALVGGLSKVTAEEMEKKLLEALQQRLPRHTVPTRLHVLPALPLTDRSKIDRRRLLEDFRIRDKKDDAYAAALAQAALPEELSAIEAKVEQVVREVLGVSEQLPSGKSFQELGYSSLLLGKLTTRVRRIFAIPGLPATDVYRFPTIRKLAAQVEELGKPDESAVDSSDVLVPLVEAWRGESPTSRLSWICMVVGIAVQSIVTEFAFLPAYYVLFQIYFNYSLLTLYVLFGPVLLVDSVITLAVSVAIKWAVLGRRRPGNHPIFGWYYWKWWFVHTVEHYVDEHVTSYLGDSEMYNVLLRALGADVASGVRVNRAYLSDIDLVSFGENVRVERDATVCPARLWGGMLQLRAIHLHEGSSVAHRAYVPGGTEVPAGMELGPMASNDKFGAHHIYPRRMPASAPSRTLALYQCCIGLPLLWFVEGFSQIPVIAFLISYWNFLVNRFRATPAGKASALKRYSSYRPLRLPRPRWGWGFISGKNAGYTLEDKRNVLFPFCLIIPWTMTFVHGVSYLLLVVFLKRVVIGKFEEGPVRDDWDMFRRWLLERLVTSETFTEFMDLFVNTEILSGFYRLLGADVAYRVNMDFFAAVEFDLIHIETDVVFGSSVLLANTHHGFSRPITLRKGACVLDHSCVMPGVVVPEGTLLGSFTVVPQEQQLDAMTVYTGCEEGTCVRLFQRPLLPGDRIEGERVVSHEQVPQEQLPTEARASDNEVWDPQLLRRPVPLPPAAVKQRELEARALQRHRSDFWFVLFNVWCILSAFVFAPLPDLVYWSTILIDFEIYDAWKDSDIGEVMAVLLIVPVFMGVTVLMFMVIILLKWVLIGKWTAGDRSYYSWFHFRWAALMVAFTCLDDLQAEIEGTWLAVLVMRLMGAKVGKNVCFFGFGFEYDLLHIGDCVCIGPDCDVTAHTVENMVMKMEAVKFEEGCNCLAGSIVMPGGQMEPWSTLIEHSQVLKGEMVPQGAFFGGLPAKLLRGYPQPSQEVQGADGAEETGQPLLGGGNASSASASRTYQQSGGEPAIRGPSVDRSDDDAEFLQYQTDNESESESPAGRAWGPVRSVTSQAQTWVRRLLRPRTRPYTAIARELQQLA